MKNNENNYQTLIQHNWRIAQSLITTATRESDWFYNYACFYAKNGNIELALNYLSKALSDNPSLVVYSQKDDDFKNLRTRPEFTYLLDCYRGIPPKNLDSEKITKLLIFDSTIILVAFALALFLFDREIGLLLFQIGIVIGYSIESVQIFVFRNRVFNTTITLPIIYGFIIFSLVSLVIDHQGLVSVNPFIYGIISIYALISPAYSWFVLGPKLKEYSALRIQGIVVDGVSFFALVLALLRSGVLIQEISSWQACSECIYYYLGQVIFFGGIFLITYFSYRNGVSISKAQIVSVVITVAYFLMVGYTLTLIGVFKLEYIVWFIILYTVILFFSLIIAIAEVYFGSDSPTQQKVTRYLLTCFFAIISVQGLYTSLLNGGLLPFSIPTIIPSISTVVTINMVMTITLWTVFLKLKGTTVMGNYISISGVTSSSINVESPFATALTALDSSGKSEMALTLMQLLDIIQKAKFSEKVQKKQALEIIEAITDEAQKPEPRKFSVMAMLPTLASLISSAATISDKAPVLLEKLKEFWK